MIKDTLDHYAALINTPDFINDDPVQFARRFDDQRDCEIASLLASTIAWGKRSMIIRDANRMFDLMDWQPYNYVMERGYEELPDMNIHRTFFASNLRHYLRGLHEVYTKYPNLDEYARAMGVSDAPYPAVRLAEALNATLAEANGGTADSRCLPGNLKTTALKRLNMALRWLVRDDGIVDLGLWRSIRPSQLRIPLDVHVGRVARDMGLLQRRSDDRQAVEQLTESLRAFRPDDPVYYDYALFGIGVNGVTDIQS